MMNRVAFPSGDRKEPHRAALKVFVLEELVRQIERIIVFGGVERLTHGAGVLGHVVQLAGRSRPWCCAYDCIMIRDLSTVAIIGGNWATSWVRKRIRFLIEVFDKIEDYIAEDVNTIRMFQIRI